LQNTLGVIGILAYHPINLIIENNEIRDFYGNPSSTNVIGIRLIGLSTALRAENCTVINNTIYNFDMSTPGPNSYGIYLEDYI